MAGIGPGPKDPSQRRRSNTPKRGEWVEIETAALNDEDCVLPELDPDKDWRDEAVKAWNSWRHDPVTVYWTSADIQYASDTISLYNEDFTRYASEIRLRLDAMALTPKGKRDQRFKVKPRIEVGKEASKEPTAAVVVDDERRKLLARV